MERDPLRLAWRTTPGRHLAAGLLLLLAGLLLVVGIDLVRAAFDQAIAGPSAQPFLRIAVPLPGGVPLVLFQGLSLHPSAAIAAGLAVLAALPVVIGLILLCVDAIGAGIGGQVLVRVQSALLDRVLGASPALRDDAAEAASLAGEPLVREGPVLGSAVLGPLQAAGMAALMLAYVGLSDWRLGGALAAMLVLVAVACARRLTLRLETARARRTESADLEGSLADLLRRIPALRAHGTGSYERERLLRELAETHRPVRSRERSLALVEALATAFLLLTPVVVFGTALWLAPARPFGPGTILACVLAAALAALAVRELMQWRRLIEQARPLLADIARSLAALQTRERRTGAAAALPRSGALVARGLSAYDPASGGRIAGVDLSVAFPSHVALVGDGDAGSRVFAALIGGQIDPSTGRLTYGGVDLTAADPAERARRFAFAGGETVLIEGTLRHNLLYGCPAAEPDLDARLAEAVSVAGLDELIHARGLAGTLDPKREPKLAAVIVESRRAVQAALRADDLDRFVDPFDPARYNHHATIGENLLFGKPIGDTFREDNLSSHPFVRAILEAEDLTKPLGAVGLSIATSMIEIFAEIPDGHPLFERFSFFSAADRAYFQDLVERRSERRRGAGSVRDRERLIGLALRYNESRHRLGLIDDTLRARLLAARGSFAKMLPASLQPAIEFYDQGRICTAASVQDNLLFGRIAADQAGAEVAVQKVIRRVLTERGLDGEVSRIGLDSPVDTHGGDLTLSQIAAVDLVRCLVRRPDVLVVERALDGLSATLADGLAARLRRALVGRGLVLVTPEISPGMQAAPFDAVIRFDRGTPHLQDRHAARAEPVPV